MRWEFLTESKKIITITLENELVDSLIDYVKEMRKIKKSSIPIAIKDSENDLIEKKRALNRWKTSFGYYNLNPDRFTFSLKDL